MKTVATVVHELPNITLDITLSMRPGLVGAEEPLPYRPKAENTYVMAENGVLCSVALLVSARARLFALSADLAWPPIRSAQRQSDKMKTDVQQSANAFERDKPDTLARGGEEAAAEDLRQHAAAADSEARLRLLLGTQAMWEADGNGVVVADSSTWRAYTGHTLEEWLGYGLNRPGFVEGSNS